MNWFTELFDRVNCLIRRFFDTNNCFSKNLKIFRFFKTFRFFHEFDQKYSDSSFAFQVGIFAVGGIIGSFLTKVLTTKFGRKGSQAINMFISIAGAANFIGAYQYSSPGMDYVIMTSSWLYNSWCKDQPADDVTIKIHKKSVFHCRSNSFGNIFRIRNWCLSHVHYWIGIKEGPRMDWCSQSAHDYNWYPW